MQRQFTFFSVVLLTLFFVQENNAASLFVSNKAEFDTAVSLAQPGDSIVLKNKVWTGVDFKLTCNGTASQLITICPETPGGASLEGGSRIEISGDYLVVSGFKITNGSNTSSAVRFYSGSDFAYHSRLTDCLINDWGPSGTTDRIHWVMMKGGYNRIDHCEFSNMNHSGVTIRVRSGADQEGYHQIDHNYFGPKPGGDGNGYESIKVGDGDYSMYALNTIVEKNYFYRCNGEVEMISNKSWKNTYRYNTIVECQGTITLRWGQQCIVEGNYFLGNGVENTGGVRITDKDHLIINNYFQNLEGDKARAAISIMSGIQNAEGGNSGHGQTKNAHILHNTIINCKESINMGYYDKDDLGDPRGPITAPENCTLANNLIWSSHAPLIKESWAPSINTTWLSNIVFGAALGIDPNSGLIYQDPKLELSSSNIYRVVPESPAINSGTPLDEPVLYDFESQVRLDNMPDIGADEFSSEEVDAFPITQADLGPHWNKDDLAIKTTKTHLLQIYPNPANQKFTLALDRSLIGTTIKLDIINMSGKIVHSELIFPSTVKHEITVNHLIGLHMIRLQNGDGVYQFKILFI